MTNSEFNELIDKALSIVRQKLTDKRVEYNPNESDRFENFRESARRHGTTPLKIALGYQNKHTDVIESWINNPGTLPTDKGLIYEKLTDRIAYDLIILGLIEDN